MTQQPLFQNAAVKVSEVNYIVRQLLENEPLLKDLWVEGELSNVSRPRSGHMYFTLKDDQASLRCVMWKPNVMRLHVPVRDGMAVEVHGSIGVYEQGGQYQLYVDGIRPAGEGALYREFMRLKAQLEEEGLFDQERKRPIPEFPKQIGIVTSPTGAALQDMLNTLRGRFPMLEVVLAPAAVQGDAAPPEIVNALKRLDDLHLDVILLARGGGSLEDLWAFNDENVVRTVAGLQTPVISGVGHETDFTLVDFASDYRAPTPTGAAVAAVPDRQELLMDLNADRQHLQNLFMQTLAAKQGELNNIQTSLRHLSPDWRIRNNRQAVDQLELALTRSAARSLKSRQEKLLMNERRLAALNPYAILQRGYAIVRNASGEVIRSAQSLKQDEAIHVNLSQGALDARVTDIQQEEKKS